MKRCFSACLGAEKGNKPLSLQPPGKLTGVIPNWNLLLVFSRAYNRNSAVAQNLLSAPSQPGFDGPAWQPMGGGADAPLHQ